MIERFTVLKIDLFCDRPNNVFLWYSRGGASSSSSSTRSQENDASKYNMLYVFRVDKCCLYVCVYVWWCVGVRTYIASCIQEFCGDFIPSFISKPLCLSIRMPILWKHPNYWAVYWPMYLSLPRSPYICNSFSLCPSHRLSICLSMFLPVALSVYLSVYVCL